MSRISTNIVGNRETTLKSLISEDIDVLNNEQKDILYSSITDFVDNYISNNRLSDNIRELILLDKYTDIRYNILNNNLLLEKINNKEIQITELPWMDPSELDIKFWKAHIDKRNKNIETKEKMATVSIFKCHKCGEMKCTSYQLQTASIDEPMTTFISCKVCGNSWKIH